MATNILNETMNAAKSTMDSARETAGHVMDSAKEGTEKAVATTTSAFFEGVRAVNNLISTIRSLDTNDALGFIGLERRRSGFSTVAIFGAGIAVGAGVGMILAPMAGSDLRKMILSQFTKATNDATTAVKDAEQKVEEAVKGAEKKVEEKVSAGAEVVKDKVTAGAEVVKDKLSAGAEVVKGTVMHQMGALADVAEDMIDDAQAGPASNHNGTKRVNKPNNVTNHRHS